MRSRSESTRHPDARTIAGVILAVLGLVYVFENRRQVTIRFVAPEVDTQLWIALLATL